jgi:GT2 family glycosyltransferase
LADVTPSLPVTVVIPTIGRRPLLTRCLHSVLRCAPAADEVLVVDQSGVLSRAGLPGTDDGPVRVLDCDGTGIARGMNEGLRAARHPLVLVTHDDCSVAPDWVQEAWTHAGGRPCLVTGRVLPAGLGPVPSVIDHDEPRNFIGASWWHVLYPNNMALDRRSAIDIGGFDERPSLAKAGEDLDFCYRWLRAELELRYEPALVVRHHAWRTPRELEHTYLVYARACGAFFGKHLRAREPGLAKPLLLLLRQGLRSNLEGVLRRRARSEDPARANLRGIPVGFVRGWLEGPGLRVG